MPKFRVRIAHFIVGVEAFVDCESRDKVRETVLNGHAYGHQPFEQSVQTDILYVDEVTDKPTVDGGTSVH